VEGGGWACFDGLTRRLSGGNENIQNKPVELAGP